MAVALDKLARPVRDLRISVTDRCNFRCVYCMPKEVFGKQFEFLRREQLLTFEEIERLTRTFAGMGVEKLRITGGEPLVRRDLPTLIGMLAALRTPDGRELDLTLTTNGAAWGDQPINIVKFFLRRGPLGTIDSLKWDTRSALVPPRNPLSGPSAEDGRIVLMPVTIFNSFQPR